MQMTWWVHDIFNLPDGPILLVSWIFWVIFSITMHELAHGWAAIWQGDDTPIRYNRMTMNPLVHMGGMSLLMFAIIGIAWGLMPVDPSKFRWGRRGRIVVAGAGPAMNIALALVALTAAAVLETYPLGSADWQTKLMTFLTWGGVLNIVLAVFNLMPFPPLDGSEILMGMSFKAYRLYQHPQAQMFGMFLLLAIFISGIGGFLFAGAFVASHRYIGAVESLLG